MILFPSFDRIYRFYKQYEKVSYSTHELVIFWSVDMARVVVQPLLDHRQILITPFGFFLDVLQWLFNDVLGASEFSLSLNIKLFHHVVALLSRKNAGCGADKIVPQIRFVREPVKMKLLVIAQIITKIQLLNLDCFPVFLQEVEKCWISRWTSLEIKLF